MQKVINALAILSFVGSASLIGGAGYLLLNREALIENVKEQVTKHATEAITNALPGMLDSAMPELPDATGGAIPAVPSTTGPAVPF
jgi:hypothetical protein